jgi:dihydroorotate dehydrogenase
VRGRLYGPALLPLALEVVSAIARQGIAVIGAGGLYRQEDIDAMLSAGAAAVQLDAVFWRGE